MTMINNIRILCIVWKFFINISEINKFSKIKFYILLPYFTTYIDLMFSRSIYVKCARSQYEIEYLYLTVEWLIVNNTITKNYSITKD